MIYLLIAIGVVVVLVVLYLVAIRVKRLGQAIAFDCVVASQLLSTLSTHMENAAAYCKKACIASLRYPPGVSDSDYWHGVNVIARLVFFFLAVCILGGESDMTLMVLPALFHTAIHVILPDIVELASAALFICCPALCGAVILEVWGLIPQGAGLFPRMGKLSRWLLGILSGACLVLAILVTGYFYLFRAAYLIDPESTQGMSLYIFGGLGLEVASVSVLALWALVVGGAGVVSLLMWIAEKTFETIGAVASFLPELLDVLALHLSHGTIGVGGKQIERDPHKYPSFPATSSQTALSSQTAPLSLPEHSSMGDAEREEVLPVETTELEETKTMDSGKNASLVSIGSFGSRTFTPVAQAIERLRAKDSILTSYYLDRTNTHIQTTIAGIRDLSHSHAEKKASMLHGETEDQANHTLLCNLPDKLVEAYQHLIGVPLPFVHSIDCHELVNAVDMLKPVKLRQPLTSQLIVTSVSALEAQNKKVQEGLAAMMKLYAEDIIETVIVVDPRSPFASRYGEETQLRFLAQLVVSLIIAHKHSSQNQPLSSVLKELHTLSPFFAVSFASQRVAVGETPKRWSWIPGVSSGSAGFGNYGDVLAQAREATARVLVEEDTRAFPAQVNTNVPCMVLLNIPIALSDRRFNACVRDNALYVENHYPFASALTVRGNGCPYPHHLGGRFLVQASCLYPLQPATFPKLQGVRNTKITPLFPVTEAIEPAISNGHVPVLEQKSDAKPAKAGTTRQKKSTASTRHVVRKNTKSAK